jgi:hypothetical protein
MASNPPSGVSASYVDSAISHLRSELRGEISELRSELLSEINRLEREMNELARQMIAAINAQTDRLAGEMQRQTVAVVGGVAATTAMLERTKQQLERDFESTREKLAEQTAADIQMEIGKKLADAAAAKAKLGAFTRDIDARFDKSLEGIYQNRLLYSLNFTKIFDEYANKLRTIGDHIFRIKNQDLEPAKRAAEVSPEQLHNLPIEVDMYRLRVRSENLDGTLSLLKTNRLEEVLESTTRLERGLRQAFAVDKVSGTDEAAVYGMATMSKLGSSLFIAATAQSAGETQGINIAPPTGGFEMFSAEASKARVEAAMKSAKTRRATGDEVKRLAAASRRLHDRGLLSQEALVMFEDFLGQDALQFVE